jgi:glutathione-independent formaldehyde dehydrogenase
MGSRQPPVKKYNEYHRDVIVNGRAHPGKIVSHHIGIEEALEAYKKLDQCIEGYSNVLIRCRRSPSCMIHVSHLR